MTALRNEKRESFIFGLQPEYIDLYMHIYIYIYIQGCPEKKIHSYSSNEKKMYIKNKLPIGQYLKLHDILKRTNR